MCWVHSGVSGLFLSSLRVIFIHWHTIHLDPMNLGSTSTVSVQDQGVNAFAAMIPAVPDLKILRMLELARASRFWPSSRLR
jgi:hypothetical protein